MPKNSNSKKPKPIEIEKEKPNSSSTKPKKPISEIDEIFAGKKRKKPEKLEKSSGDVVIEPKKVKKNKEKSVRIRKDNVFSEVPRHSRKKTADGFTLYTEEELGIGKSNAGVKRFEPEIVTASVEPCNGYKSKDVVIDPLKPIFGRMYLPDVPESGVHQQFPVLVYFHGGGFCIGSTTWLGYYIFLGDLSVASKSITLSVDYRLAPENKLPIAYEDCYSALGWLIKNLENEPWLKRADLSRVFLSGDSAGGNIVHQVAISAMTSEGFRGRLKGLLPIHPYFGSEKMTELEMANGSAGDVEMNDMFWRLSLPQGTNRDYFGCNFENAELSVDEWSQFPAVIVFVAGLDFLKERGVTYAEFLKGERCEKS